DNASDEARQVTLFVALRPFQVNPIWQSLNMIGGAAPIHEIRYDGGSAWVNRDKTVIPAEPPDAFGAASFEQGSIVDFLREGSVPPQTAASDRFGFASGAFQYTFSLPPGGRREISLA